MQNIGKLSDFHFVFLKRLHDILSNPTPTATSLVLVLNHAIALRDKKLISAVMEKSKSLDISDQTKLDNRILKYLEAIDRPLELVRHRQTTAGWLVSFNALRALRPPRDSSVAITNIHKKFDPQAFNFNLTISEKFWSGQVDGRPVELFYSKFPLEPYHSLIVPERTASREQYLESRDHQIAWDMAEKLGEHQPRLLIGYNTHGGGESINHLHFQYLPSSPELPIFEDDFVSHYPLPMVTATSAASAWKHISKHQAHNQPFNLIYRPGLVHIIERNFSGHRPNPDWTGGFAWYELAGGILTLKLDAYNSLNDSDIALMFQNLRP